MDLTQNKKKGPITWTEEVKEELEDIKQICAEDAMLHYPGFNKPFELHTDSSEYQIGTIISLNGRPVAYWSKKLSTTHTKYPTTD